MQLDMTREEFSAIRKIIINLNSVPVTEVWNQIVSPVHTRVSDANVTIIIAEEDAINFLNILNKQAKPFGDIIRKGIKITDLGELKRILNSLSEGIKRSFKHW